MSGYLSRILPVEIAAVKKAALVTVFLCPFSVRGNQSMFAQSNWKKENHID
jgi:hypothetical protein